jgi:MoxR-like ATPase
VYNQKTCEFTPKLGPVFTNFILADEINRAPAKVQSALLECMQERQVTLGDTTHTLPDPFIVLATQNPIEQEGTYPLPEAQVDRFMLKIPMQHPGREEELTLARRMLGTDSPEAVLKSGAVQAVISAGTLTALRRRLEEITVKEELTAYLVDIVRQTRKHQGVLVGAGPRATQALLLSSRAHAALCERDFVTPDDIKAQAVAVLGHRIILRPEYEIEGLAIEEVVQQILQEVTVPR